MSKKHKLVILIIIAMVSLFIALLTIDLLRNEINSDVQYGIKDFMMIFGLSSSYDSLKNFIDDVGIFFLWVVFMLFGHLIYDRVSQRMAHQF